MLVSQCFGQRAFHDQAKFTQAADIVGQQVVLHHPSILSLIPINDGVVALKKECWSVDRFVAFHVQTTSCINGIYGDS